MTNALNLQEINQENLLHLAKLFIKSGKNLFVFGQKGTGKTEIIMQAIRESNYKVIYINLSVIERADLMGYPNLQSMSDVVDFKSPVYLPKLIDGNKPDSIILFDEVDKAPPEVTAPLLEILQFKSINGKRINVAACVLTGNLANEGAYSNQISSALLDRGAKYILQFNFNQWIDWAKANDVHDLILGFLRNDPSFACGKVDDTCYASPSPRGWTLASDALVKAKKLKISDIDTVTQIVSGFVGSEAGLRFKIWYEYYRKFEPQIHSIIELGFMPPDFSALDFSTLMPTEKVVFVIGACHLAKQKALGDTTKSKFVYLENLCNFFVNYSIDPEVQVIGLHNSFSFEQITKNKLYACKKFFDHFTKLSDKIAFNK